MPPVWPRRNFLSSRAGFMPIILAPSAKVTKPGGLAQWEQKWVEGGEEGEIMVCVLVGTSKFRAPVKWPQANPNQPWQMRHGQVVPVLHAMAEEGKRQMRNSG